MIVHHDGYAENARHWTDEFLAYDLIGAPWPCSVNEPFGNSLVGNGGFTIRSRRFLDACKTCPPLPLEGWGEDQWFCVANRSHFLNSGCVFAPAMLALKFSLETPIQLGNTTLFLTRKDAKDAALQHVEAVGDDLFLKHKSKEEVMSGILSELAVAKAKEPEPKQGVLSKLLKSKEKSQKVPPKKKDLGMRPKGA